MGRPTGIRVDSGAGVSVGAGANVGSGAGGSVDLGASVGAGVPAGGTAGQVLTKTATGTAWQDPQGGGGTSDYNALSNKPAINGTTLQGNKTAAQLGLVAAQQGAGLITDAERQQIQTNADDIAEAQTEIGKKYTKPSGGIPASDLAAGVIPTVPTKTSELQNDSGFVDASGAASAAPVQSVNGQTGAVTVNVPSAASSGTPAMDGTASRGSSTQYARADHRHPSDTTKYTKPSTGIPKSDLADAVQTSLGKADTALQAVPSTYRTAAAQDTIDAGKIDKPSNPATGAFLVWNGSTWSAQTLATWQGGSY